MINTEQWMTWEARDGQVTASSPNFELQRPSANPDGCSHWPGVRHEETGKHQSQTRPPLTPNISSAGGAVARGSILGHPLHLLTPCLMPKYSRTHLKKACLILAMEEKEQRGPTQQEFFFLRI